MSENIGSIFSQLSQVTQTLEWSLIPKIEALNVPKKTKKKLLQIGSVAGMI
jgi:hypothetical protein